MQNNTGVSCIDTVRKDKRNTPAPTYTRMKEEYPSTNCGARIMVFSLMTLKQCVTACKKKWNLDRLIVFSMWPFKLGFKLSREEELALEDVKFHLQQRDALPPYRRQSTITALSNLRSHFLCAFKSGLSPNFHTIEDSAAKSNKKVPKS